MAKRKVREYELTNGVVYYMQIDGETHVHISRKNTKIGRIHNISLLPGDEPLARKDGTVLTNLEGTCHGCCDGCGECCYAKNSAICHHNANIPAWGENTMLAKEAMEQFFEEIHNYMKHEIVPVFRLHVAGEFFSYEYMKTWAKFADEHRDTIFYVYTKRFAWLEKLEREYKGSLPDNFHVLVSIWHKNYDNPNGFAEFIYDDGTEPELKNVVHCPAVNADGHETGITCAECRRCIHAKKGMVTAVYAH